MCYGLTLQVNVIEVLIDDARVFIDCRFTVSFSVLVNNVMAGLLEPL